MTLHGGEDKDKMSSSKKLLIVAVSLVTIVAVASMRSNARTSFMIASSVESATDGEIVPVLLTFSDGERAQ